MKGNTSVLTLKKGNVTHSLPSQSVSRMSASLREMLLSWEQQGRKTHTEGPGTVPAFTGDKSLYCPSSISWGTHRLVFKPEDI